jgi:hypothetical protein
VVRLSGLQGHVAPEDKHAMTAKIDPCGNEDCDKCYPLPRFKISTERVQRLFYERTIKAANEAEALAIYAEGTAWPSSYDDRSGEVLEQKDPIVTIEEPLTEIYCYHNLPSQEEEEFLKRSEGT